MSGRTRWRPSADSPIGVFLRTEAGSAAVLVAATVAALVWANLSGDSYASVWRTDLSIRVGDAGVALDLREWVNSGLMTFFFFVVGLEARREFDMGELRDRQRVVLPLTAGVGGMLAPVAIYLALNAGRPSAHGWAVAMSTDTALALGLLALVGRSLPDRVRAFLLTVVVVDDLLALVVIASVYSGPLSVGPLLVALGCLVALLVLRSAGVGYGLVYLAVGVTAWVAMLRSGIDPVVVGLGMGLLTYAYTPGLADLERATGLFRLFREQPTPELARSASAGLAAALSPNERLQRLYHPWASYVIVPLFALANAGISLDGDLLGRALTSRITLGITIGYVVGKPFGVVLCAWLVTTLSRGRLRAPVGWAALTGAGAIAGIGFTLSLLIATLAFQGDDLDEAKLGVLLAALIASLLTWLVFRVTAMLPTQRRSRALLGTGDTLIDLAVPVDPARDHIRGPSESLVTVVEYGDFECPYCGQAEPAVRALLADHGEVRYVWRHLPLTDVHPRAGLAAEAAEAAAEQGQFWAMHDILFEHQEELTPGDLIRYASELGLDVERFRGKLRSHALADRVAKHVDSAALSGVAGTPTFFINGRRHYGAYDIDTLSAAVRTAKARAAISRQEPTSRRRSAGHL